MSRRHVPDGCHGLLPQSEITTPFNGPHSTDPIERACLGKVRVWQHLQSEFLITIALWGGGFNFVCVCVVGLTSKINNKNSSNP